MNILHYLSDKYLQIKERDFFLNIFQSILFLWILSIPLKNALYQVSTALIVILFFIHYFYYKQKDFLLEILTTYKKLLIVFLLFIASMTLSTLLGISDKSELLEIFKYIYRYVFIFIILLYFYKQSLFSRQWLLSVIFIVLCINSLDGIYQYFTGIDFIANKTPDGSSLLTGAVYHHNPFGLFMAIGAIMSLVLFFDKHNYTIFKYDKIMYFTSLIMFFFTLFHSQSRSAWVMFGILLLQGNSSGRTTQIWPFTIDKIVNSPIFGYGINTYKILASGSPAGHHAGVHNLTLELLLYTGVAGFLIFLYLIGITLKESLTDTKIIYFILFSSYMILLQFDGSLIDSKVHLNIFIFILFFIYSFRLERRTSSSEN
jgi:O-antigen ligase